MMKFILMMLFMIPLCFIKNFWMYFMMYNLLIFFMLMKFSFNYMFMYTNMLFGMDLLSFIMILLTMWICSLMILASSSIYLSNNYSNMFKLNLLILMISLILTFSSMNFFMFYLFFEISLIPTLMLILGWGYQPERLQAGIYLLFYTMFGSLPMLVSIMYYYSLNKSLSLFFLNFPLYSLFMFLCMIIVFMIKMPMFFFHLWLPKAHVESPISGSMILAGVMLKLGGYGLMRILPIFMKIMNSYNYIFMSISLMGGFMVSLMCLRQSDMKSLVAYSSVAHMGLVIGGLMTFSYWGMTGSLAMMVAHGLCSSGLFCLVNLNYERIFSRSLFLNKGMINLLPSLSLFWFLMCSSNMAAPPSLNLMSEIFLINSIVHWESYTMFFLALISFFSAAYSLFLYSYTQHGKYFSGIYKLSFCNIREFLLLMMHWLPLNLLFLKPEIMTLWL
uniref:NADH-ubiquinone oxidoreductase chain 4 n=1 Tax=Coleoptera sp. ACP-2013 TaxID=2485033 RepID=A0A3G3MEI2_9COLE|nr:NADH dehydrogenase subunit 4 [Coleoptera sp. ACP-2013]